MLIETYVSVLIVGDNEKKVGQLKLRKSTILLKC